MIIGFEDIKASLFMVKKNLMKCFALAFVFFIVGIVTTINNSVDNLYYASTSLYSPISTDYNESVTLTQAVTNYSSLIKSQKVAERAISIMGSTELTYRQVQNMTSYYVSSTGTDITITVVSANPDEAVSVVNAVANAYIEEMRTMTGMDAVQVLTSAMNANLSENGLVSLWKKRIVFFAAGFVVMAFLIFVLELFSDKIRSAEQCFINDDDVIIGILPEVKENHG